MYAFYARISCMKRYAVREAVPEDIQKELAAFSERIQSLLYYRGITTAADAERFLAPDYERDLHDPFLLPNMHEAVDRILQAIAQNERVTIFADYDADGVPGAVVLHDFFTKIGFTNFDVYIPHRNKEGFGLNMSAVEQLAEQGTQLLITIDCGIADVAEVAHARELGVDVVVTDHHELPGERPDAIIVDHKLPESTYPEANLCGSGVIFKVVQALIMKGDFDLPAGSEKWLLDMVGIATLSDMVPLVGENRALAHYGLVVLRKSPRKGLLKLLRKTGTKQHTLSETDIGFTISPRINAASRMGEPKVAFDMLATHDEVEADMHVAHLHEINDARKGHVAAIVKAIHKKADIFSEKQTVVCGDVSWQPSLLGLAASSITDTYGKPVFLWGRGDGKELKGSCRSVPGISTLAIMQATPEAFITFGGHAQAGGFVVDFAEVDYLHDRLETAFSKTVEAQEPEIHWIDAQLSIDDVHHHTYSEIRKLAPFGIGNPEPVFLFKNTMIKRVESFGKQQDHLRIVCHSDTQGDIEAISFYAKPDSFTRSVAPGDKRDVVATIEKSQWGRAATIRLRLVDIL